MLAGYAKSDQQMLWGMQAVQEVQGQGSITLPCPDAYVYHFVAGA